MNHETKTWAREHPILTLTAALLGSLLVLLAVPAGESTVVAVGNAGAIRTSTDGTSWPTSTSGTTVNLYGVASGNGLIVAVGAGGTILTSPDGLNWTQRCPNPPGAGTGCVATDLKAVAYNGTTWMAVGASSTVLTSPNGTAWTPRAPGLSGTFNAVASTSGQWAVAGVQPSGSGLLIYSTDAVSWASRFWSSASVMAHNGVAYSGTQYVVVGSKPNAPNSMLDYAPAPISGVNPTWTAVGGAACWGIAYEPNQDRWVAVCDSAIYSVSPGASTSWASQPISSGRAIAYDGQWVMVGAGGAAATSPNAAGWTSQSTGTDLNAIAVLPNHPPVNLFNTVTFPGGLSGNVFQTTAAGTARVFNSANGNRITVSDMDALATDNLRLTLSASSGTLSLGGTSGLSFTCLANTPVTGLPACSGTGTSNTAMTFRGTIANINTALNGLSFTPDAGTCGPPHEVITITLHDEANRGLGGDLVDTDTITVYCALACSPNAASILVGATSTVTGVGANGTYTWTAGGSATWTGSPTAYAGNPFNVTWSSAGTHTVTITEGAMSATCTVTVVNVLQCSASPSSVAMGASSSLSASGPPGPYTWTATGGFPASGSGTPLAVTYSAVGTQTATVTTTNPAQSATCNITVLIPPLACSANLPIVYSGTSTLVTATGGTPPYTWSPPGPANPPAYMGNPFGVSWNVANTYIVTVVDSGAPAQTSTCNVSVQPPLSSPYPEGTFTMAGRSHSRPIPDISVVRKDCSHFTVDLDGRGSVDPDGLVAGYAWDFGAGAQSTQASARHTYEGPGTHVVALTVRDDEGLTATRNLILDLRACPTVPSLPASDQPAMQGPPTLEPAATPGPLPPIEPVVQKTPIDSMDSPNLSAGKSITPGQTPQDQNGAAEDPPATEAQSGSWWLLGVIVVAIAGLAFVAGLLFTRYRRGVHY